LSQRAGCAFEVAGRRIELDQAEQPERTLAAASGPRVGFEPGPLLHSVSELFCEPGPQAKADLALCRREQA
jgi:hypothetical protein